MSQKLSLSGFKSGRLTGIKVIGKNSRGQNIWECLCDCGEITSVTATILKNGYILSCGCIRNELTGKRFTTHGKSNTGEYVSWAKMKSRCYKKSDSRYSTHGGRGIIVCDRWLGENGFVNFLSDMGPKPSPKHSLDRYPNNETGIYEPINCRWGTSEQQARNRRSSINITYNGVKKCLKEWAEYYGVKYETFRDRIKNGWPFERAAGIL